MRRERREIGQMLVWKIPFSVSDGLCRLDRVVVEHHLRRPIPIARAYFKLPRAGRGDCMACAMPVSQAFQLSEEHQ